MISLLRYDIVLSIMVFGKLTQLFQSFKGPNPEFADRSVLIVDDNDVDRKLIERTLERIGCRVLSAVDGEIGLFIATAEKPDLILSDCNMPNMDGLTMCRKLKESPDTKDIPVIFLTSIDTPSNVVDCFEQEAENFICKPINTKILRAQIESLLKEHFPAEEA